MSTHSVILSRSHVLEQLDITAASIKAGIEHRVPDSVALAALQLKAWLESLEQSGQPLPDKCNDVALEELVNETMIYLNSSRTSTTTVWRAIIQLNKSKLWKGLHSVPFNPLVMH
jgi:hypothetical protein